MQDLTNLMTNAGVNLGGYTLLNATAISSDGQFIGGGAVGAGAQAYDSVGPYVMRYCDATVSGACKAYNALVAGGGSGGGGSGADTVIAGITTLKSVQSSVNQLARAGSDVMANDHGFAAPLLGENAPLSLGTEAAAYRAGGSVSGGGGLRYQFGHLTLLGGIGGASESYTGVQMNDALLLAGAVRWIQPFGGAWSGLAEAGGFWSPSGTYDFSRTYLNGAGTAVGAGSAPG
jgi:hypothetical protein